MGLRAPECGVRGTADGGTADRSRGRRPADRGPQPRCRRGHRGCGVVGRGGGAVVRGVEGGGPGQAGVRTAGRRLAMTFLARLRGLVRNPYPHDMCIVARATGIRTRAFNGRPLPAGTEPSVIAAR
ncbi:hypothetical protein BG846_04344 [Streptomyces fradiae ATCC 10745 = DSM 40063]|uniref:Uncharacterized protein n=1 Tax=Streptomyces fradiae ATCC 10745 = DSM 40063 TaxID=1319510 RepID=A0A1Y2NRB0_STRFR|nr:hypothetical protein BG846_04344 [Streptomyces fradiae ATCC 10745 = DSM 40063]